MPDLHIELHVLHPVPPNAMNTQEDGTPKTCVFGNAQRARVSSQCWNRAVREDMKHRLPQIDLGVRTLANNALVRELQGHKDADKVVAAVFKLVTTEGKKDKKKKDVLRFLSAEGFQTFVSLVKKNASAILEAKPGDKLANELTAAIFKPCPGTALFGRMMADAPKYTTDSSIQVAHAISVNSCENEVDYFTGMDELNTENTGAGHLNDQEFVSPILYRWLSMDLVQWRQNLQSEDEGLFKKLVSEWLLSNVRTVPGGKKTSYGHMTQPMFVGVMLKQQGYFTNLANAFLQPIRSSRPDIDSINRLTDFWNRTDAMDPQQLRFGSYTSLLNPDPKPVKMVKGESLPKMVEKLVRSI
jgi:CRISPR system Cascade subunit CasC